jgi:sulfide:quinone oxidoreductase
VGSGVFNIGKTRRSEKEVMPEGVTWIRQKVTAFDPANNSVLLDSGARARYDFLVVAPGIQLNWDSVKGLRETIGKNNVCSNYSYEYAPYTFECIKNFRGGTAIFHSPDTPVKCGGAPQKIMYMAADYFRRHSLSGKADIQFWSGGSKLFGIPEYEKTLLKICQKDQIGLHFKVRLVEIDGPGRKVKFIGIAEENKGQEYWVHFDMIHITPPQSAPDFIRNSPIANESGWVEADKYTLQHPRFPNIFTLGDAAGLPSSKTGAAIRKQAPVLVRNLMAAMAGQPLTARYNGYSSCPILTGYGRLMLAEFDYDNKRTETFPFDQSKPRWSMYMLKRHILPWLYWRKILPGKM